MEGRSSTAPSRPPNPALPYREDCWSEGETAVLIEAWGDRFIEVNRGSLRQKQWQEVADAVNSRPCDARRPPRTDVQCKNRVDTLKKKYKSEKSKIAAGSAGSSSWNFYPRMDFLIGPSVTPSVKKPSPSPPPLALPLPPNRKPFPLPAAAAAASASARPAEMLPKRRNLSEESDSSAESIRERSQPGRRVRRKRTAVDDGNGIRELSKAISRLAEIYETVEEEKQRQMVELEKQRMEFTKELEFQRMQMFADSQVQMARMDRRARRAGSRGDDGDNGSAALLPFLLQPVLL